MDTLNLLELLKMNEMIYDLDKDNPSCWIDIMYFKYMFEYEFMEISDELLIWLRDKPMRYAFVPYIWFYINLNTLNEDLMSYFNSKIRGLFNRFKKDTFYKTSSCESHI